MDDATFSLSWDELRASDVAGRARAFGIFAGAGIATEEAKTLAGL